MNNAVIKREHFNLYYIFLDDKQNNLLSHKKAAEMLEIINKKTNRYCIGFSPPDG